MINKPFTDEAYCKSMRKLHRFFDNDCITFDEFASNLLGYLVLVEDETRRTFLDTLPRHVVYDLAVYTRDYLRSCEFMPSPTEFTVGNETPEQLEAKKQELQSRYIAMLNALEDASNK